MAWRQLDWGGETTEYHEIVLSSDCVLNNISVEYPVSANLSRTERLVSRSVSDI
jgi:hypothetical protein